jgi:hypothetical protein
MSQSELMRIFPFRLRFRSARTEFEIFDGSVLEKSFQRSEDAVLSNRVITFRKAFWREFLKVTNTYMNVTSKHFAFLLSTVANFQHPINHGCGFCCSVWLSLSLQDFCLQKKNWEILHQLTLEYTIYGLQIVHGTPFRTAQTLAKASRPGSVICSIWVLCAVQLTGNG